MLQLSYCMETFAGRVYSLTFHTVFIYLFGKLPLLVSNLTVS